MRIYPMLAYCTITGLSTNTYTQKYLILNADIAIVKITQNFAGGSATGTTVVTVYGYNQADVAISDTATIPYNAIKGQVYRVGTSSNVFKSVYNVTIAGDANGATSGNFKIVPGNILTFKKDPKIQYSDRIWRVEHQIQLGNINYDTLAVRDIISLQGNILYQDELEYLCWLRSQSFPVCFEYNNGYNTIVWDGVTLDTIENRVRKELKINTLPRNPYPASLQNKYSYNMELVET